MSGVLHPVGPETARTYWLRRAVILGVLIMLVAGLIGVGATFGRGSSTAAGAGPEMPSTAAPVSATPTTTPTSGPSAASTSPSSEPTSGAKASSTPSMTASTKPSTAPTAKPVPVACNPGLLRPTIVGDRSLKVDQKTTFALSVINGSGVPCVLTVSSQTWELKIYSGTDRIWTTKSCPSAVKPARITLAAEKAFAWQQPWNGRRSASTCKSTADLPRPGVYWATSQYAGAKPVQLRMILR